MKHSNHDPSNPHLDRELSLDELDQVSGGSGFLSVPGNFTNGFVGGAIYGTGAKDSQIAVFGDRNAPGFAAGVETGMMLNMGLGPVGSALSNGASALVNGASGAISGIEHASQAASDYLNPSPGHGAPGDTYVPAAMGADGALVPGHFEAPAQGAPGSLSDQAGINDIGHEPVQPGQGEADHGAGAFGLDGVQHEAGASPGAAMGVDHSGEQSAPGGSSDHAGEQSAPGGTDTTGDHGNGYNGNDYNGNDYGGTQYAGGDFGGGDFGGGDFGGGGDFA